MNGKLYNISLALGSGNLKSYILRVPHHITTNSAFGFIKWERTNMVVPFMIYVLTAALIVVLDFYLIFTGKPKV